MNIVFDTLKLARGLEEAGFEHQQALKTAEILSSTIGEAVVTRDYLDTRLAELEASTNQKIASTIQAIKALEASTNQKFASTQQEIKGLEASTIQAIKALEASTNQKIASTQQAIKGLEASIELAKRDLTIRLGGMLVTGIVAVAALIKLL